MGNRKQEKNRQYNGKNNKNNDQQNTTLKTKD